MIEVIKCGTRVVTKTGALQATITGIHIEFEKVSYKLGWFNSGRYETAWADECEFEVLGEEGKTAIGFK